VSYAATIATAINDTIAVAVGWKWITCKPRTNIAKPQCSRTQAIARKAIKFQFECINSTVKLFELTDLLANLCRPIQIPPHQNPTHNQPDNNQHNRDFDEGEAPTRMRLLRTVCHPRNVVWFFLHVTPCPR
jgi:hypothetical protein